MKHSTNLIKTRIVGIALCLFIILGAQTASATLYHVGDTYNENGLTGVIYWMEPGAIAANAPGTHFLLFSPQLGNAIDWTQANQLAGNYGSGWHLPKGGAPGTLPYAELALLGNFHRTHITFDFPDGNYWGSEISPNAFYSVFSANAPTMGTQYKTFHIHARAVYIGTFGAPVHNIGDIFNGGIIYWMDNATGQPNTEYLIMKSADVGTTPSNWSGANALSSPSGWHLPTGGANGTTQPGDEIWKLNNFHIHNPHYSSDNLVATSTYWGAQVASNPAAAWFFSGASPLGGNTISKTPPILRKVRLVLRGSFPQ